MTRQLIVFLAFCAVTVFAQPADQAPNLHGRIEGRYYVAANGAYRIVIPVLEELGGKVTDTENSVTFRDDYNLHVSIACFSQDASQRWELSTRGLKDYLEYFLRTYVLPDFMEALPGSKIESVRFSPSIMEGSLLVYTLTPGGTMFAERLGTFGANQEPPVAKRALLIYVHNEHIFIIGTELAERVLEGKSYHKTTAEEDEILRQRLIDLLDKIGYRNEAPK